MRPPALLSLCFFAAAWLFLTTFAGRPADLVDGIPGFDDAFKRGVDFSVYSGYLYVDVSDTSLAYDALSIHYELHTCVEGGLMGCPLAVWHQGGPGGSAVFGAWTEMGPFKLMSQGPVTNFDNAWNNVANMLYLESPAGSTIADDGTGWSSCSIRGVKQDTCTWDDVSQAVAYKATLEAFYAAFHEVSGQPLYLVGESYAGQYIPNIVNYLLQNPLSNGVLVQGIALGNACWGGDEDTVLCNGEHENQMDVDIYHGKGLISEDLYQRIQAACDWDSVARAKLDVVAKKQKELLQKSRNHPKDEEQKEEPFSFLPPKKGITAEKKKTKKTSVVSADDCYELLDEAEDAVGPFNVYNVYDDCDLHPTSLSQARDELPATTYSAGYPWNCESDPALDAYFARADVQRALHLTPGSGSGFRYSRSGPASLTLYPTILPRMRVLIYNGDADLCVPYVGNERWTASMADQGYAVEAEPWRPWYLLEDSTDYAPAGYVTTYTVPNKQYTARGDDFTFLTVRLAGHMVPQFQPEVALTFFARFLRGDSF